MADDMFPANYTRVWVRGRIIDLVAAVEQRETIGLNESPITFTPSTTVLLDSATRQIISSSTPMTATPQGLDGYFEIQLPATDDPNINPVGWTYSVKEPTGRVYDINVPWDTPGVNDVSDPLNGQKVIDLVDLVPESGPNPGVVQLLQGRGISSIELESSGHLIVTYSDGLTTDMGILPVASIRGAQDYDNSTAPTNQALLRWNATKGKFEPGALTYPMLPVGTIANTVAAGNDARFSDARAPLAHTHQASDITTGVLPLARIPTGTTANTVALGSHSHLMPNGVPQTITDSSMITTNASNGNVFRISILGNRTLAAPSNPTDGQVCTWEVTASGADRTLTVPTGAGGFDLSDVMAPVSRINSGKQLAFTARYSSVTGKWFVTQCTPKSEPMCSVLLNTLFWVNNDTDYCAAGEWKPTAEVDTHGMYTWAAGAWGTTYWTIPFTGRWLVHLHVVWKQFGVFDASLGIPLSGAIMLNSVTPAGDGATTGTISETVATGFRMNWASYDALCDRWVFKAGDVIRANFYAKYIAQVVPKGTGLNYTAMTIRYLGQN